MKFSLKNASIRDKVRWVIALTTGAALLFASIALVALEISTYRRGSAEQLASIAEILAANSVGAVEFNDVSAAQELLDGLSANPRVVSGWLFDVSGHVFARYQRSGSAAGGAVPQLAPPGSYFEAGGVIVVRPVMLNGRLLGSIRLEAGLKEVYERLWNYLLVVAGVFLISFAAAVLLSLRLQRGISRPLAQLADAARRVSADKDYSVRVKAESGDEVGVLINQFNDMLTQIQERDVQLEKARAIAEEQARDLARSNHELEQFAYVASHDLKEPLRMVGSYTQLLARRYAGKLGADADEFIGFAVDGVKRMQTLIDDLLAYSRVGSAAQKSIPVDTGAIMVQVSRNLGEAMREAGASVTWVGLPTLHGDPVQFTQLFQNIVANAIKFHSDKPPEVRVEAQRTKSEWAFTIRDNGIGIDPQFADKIFVMFKRLHAAQKYRGTGIGLAICKKIVERMGGQIWVESELGKGATFHFTIPAKREQPTAGDRADGTAAAATA